MFDWKKPNNNILIFSVFFFLFLVGGGGVGVYILMSTSLQFELSMLEIKSLVPRTSTYEIRLYIYLA